jgi:hypothetical protein
VFESPVFALLGYIANNKWNKLFKFMRIFEQIDDVKDRGVLPLIVEIRPVVAEIFAKQLTSPWFLGWSFKTNCFEDNKSSKLG